VTPSTDCRNFRDVHDDQPFSLEKETAVMAFGDAANTEIIALSELARLIRISSIYSAMANDLLPNDIPRSRASGRSNESSANRLPPRRHALRLKRRERSRCCRHRGHGQLLVMSLDPSPHGGKVAGRTDGQGSDPLPEGGFRLPDADALHHKLRRGLAFFRGRCVDRQGHRQHRPLSWQLSPKSAGRYPKPQSSTPRAAVQCNKVSTTPFGWLARYRGYCKASQKPHSPTS
jgi:hypothetical protein